MEVSINLAVLSAGVIIVLVAVGLIVLAAIGQVETIQKNWPRIKTISEYKSGIAFLLFANLIVLAGLGIEVYKKEVPDVASPNFKIPSIPVPVYQLPKQKAPSKPGPDNSVHMDKGSKIEQKTSGPCSPASVGGTVSVTCGPPPITLDYTFETIQQGQQAYFSFDRTKCPIVTHMRVVPNQSVPPPVRIALDFDHPVTEIGTTVENAGATTGGGPFRVGLHAISSPISPGIGPSNPLIVEVCSAVQVKLTSVPQLVN